MEKGIQLAKMVIRLDARAVSLVDIARECEITVEAVEKILK